MKVRFVIVPGADPIAENIRVQRMPRPWLDEEMLLVLAKGEFESEDDAKNSIPEVLSALRDVILSAQGKTA